MQIDAERTLSNLHVLGALLHNDKIMTNEDAFDIYSPTSMRGLFRAWYGERRSANIARIRQAVRSAITFSSHSLEETIELLGATSRSDQLKLRTSSTAMQHMRMCDALRRARAGLHNLVQTYRDDAASSSQMALLMAEIDDYIQLITPHTDELRRQCNLPITLVAEHPRRNLLGTELAIPPISGL